jgi:hypothetical protein
MAKKKAASKKPTTQGKLYLTRDPRVFRTDVPKLAPRHKRVAGLDLGISCGVAFCDIVPGCPTKGGTIYLGQWDLSIGPYDAGPLRHIRLKQFLGILEPDLVMFEDVKYDPPKATVNKGGLGFILARVVPTAEFLGALKMTVASWCEEFNIPAHGLQIAQIKKWATDHGRANKVDMIKAANERFGTTFDPETYESTGVDNICDAGFACAMGVEAYSEGL